MHTSSEHPVLICLFVQTVAVLLPFSFLPLTSVTLKRQVNNLCCYSVLYNQVCSFLSALFCPCNRSSIFSLNCLFPITYFSLLVCSLDSQRLYLSCYRCLHCYLQKGWKEMELFLWLVSCYPCLNQWESVTRITAAFDCFSAGISQLTKVCMGLWRYKSLHKCLAVIIIIIIINFKMPEVGF